MGIGDWGLGIGDWGLGVGRNPQSPIPNPHCSKENILLIKIIFLIFLYLVLYLNKIKIFDGTK